MKSFVEFNIVLLKFFYYVTWFDESKTGGLANKAYFSKTICSFIPCFIETINGLTLS